MPLSADLKILGLDTTPKNTLRLASDQGLVKASPIENEPRTQDDLILLLKEVTGRVRSSFMIETENSDENTKTKKKSLQDAERNFYIPLEIACEAAVEYFITIKHSDLNKSVYETDSNLVLLFLKCRRALRLLENVLSNPDKRMYLNSEKIENFFLVVTQTFNKSIVVQDEKVSLADLDTLASLSDEALLEVIFEVVRIKNTDDGAERKVTKDQKFFAMCIASSISCTKENVHEIKNDTYTTDDLIELKLFSTVGEKLLQRIKQILSRMYLVARKAKLSPKEQEFIISLSRFIFELDNDEISDLNSSTILLLGITNYGELWKTIRILLRAQELDPELAKYSLSNICENILDNIDNEDILDIDLELSESLTKSNQVYAGSLMEFSEEEILTDFKDRLHSIKSRVELSKDEASVEEVLAPLGIEKVVIIREGSDVVLNILFSEASLKVFYNYKTNTLDWDRLHPFAFASTDERAAILDILSQVNNLLSEKAVKKVLFVSPTPLPPSKKGPRRSHDGFSPSFHFSDSLSVNSNGSVAEEHPQNDVVLNVANLAAIDVFFPKRIPREVKEIIKEKLQVLNIKFLKKLDYAYRGMHIYRYKVQSYRVVLVAAENSTQNNFNLEIIMVGHRKEIYTKLKSLLQ